MNLGGIYKKLNNLDQALASTLKSLELEPDNPDALINLGGIYKNLGNLDQALASTLKSLELKPDNPTALMNLGGIYKNLGNLDLAFTFYKNTLSLRPNCPKTTWNLSEIMLLTGDYTKGWKNYECRFEAKGVILEAVPSLKRWRGERLEQNNKLIIISEQGIGDILQFARYINFLKSEGISVEFCVGMKLHSLCRASGIEPSPLDRKYISEIKEGKWVPLLSIPQILKICPENPITTEPYIKGEKKLLKKWSKILPKNKLPIIGINWRSNRKDLHINLRDIPFKHFVEMRNKTDAVFLSLQREAQESELNEICFKHDDLEIQREVSKVADSNEAADFLEYASIVANCNLIITNDTTVAHLAASMGVPTWILLPKIPNWRWGLNGDKSFWYPSVKLFRQKNRGEWGIEIKQVTKELEKFIEGLNIGS